MFAVNGCWKRNSFSTSLLAAGVVVAVAVVDTHDGSVDTVDWPLQLCMNLAVAAAARNTILVDVENGCLVVRGHASFWCVLSNHEALHRNCDKTGSYTCWKGPKI